MDHAPIVNRLRSQVSALRLVDFALNFDALKAAGIPAMPAAFVLPSRIAARPNRLATGGFHQDTREQFQLYTFLKSVQKKLGADAHDEQNALATQIFDALLGWSPATGAGLIELERGGAVELRDGVLVYLYEFAVESQYRRVT